MKYATKELRKPICQLISGSLLVTVGCAVFITSNWFVNCLLKNLRTLQPNTNTFEVWHKNPLPLTFDFYVFNWTNPEDIYEPNIKPRFEEIGPFVFKETKEKVNITWNNNDTVTYRCLRHWYFDESKSVANLSTKIITVNAVAVAAAYRMRYWNYFLQKGFDMSLRTLFQKIYVEKSIGEIIFDGYDDPVIDIARALPKNLDIPQTDKFGWFYERNGSYTYDGTFNIGINENNLGELYSWNYKNELSYFTGNCNKIKGSAGDFYNTNLQKNTVEFFWPDICRTVAMDFEEEVYVDGTKGYKYGVGYTFLDNGTKVPENVCYASGTNIPSGVMNVSTCKFGAPGFISLPHFYGADSYYTDKIEGLHPKKELHEMFAIFEPSTGAPLQVEAKFQLNFLLQPSRNIKMFKGVPSVYMPILWIEQKVVIDSYYHFHLKFFLHLPIILKGLAGIFTLIGLLIFSFVVFFRRSDFRYYDWLKKEETTQVEMVSENKEEAKQLL